MMLTLLLYLYIKSPFLRTSKIVPFENPNKLLFMSYEKDEFRSAWIQSRRLNLYHNRAQELDKERTKQYHCETTYLVRCTVNSLPFQVDHRQLCFYFSLQGAG